MIKVNKNEFCEETQEWSRYYCDAGVTNAIPSMDLDERLRIIEKRLLIIDPPAETLSKYPALAEAYREYKLIEKLTLENE